MLFCAECLIHSFISDFSRNVLVESARIARGKIASLTKLTTADHDAVIFPGGFGAAKNLWVPIKHQAPELNIHDQIFIINYDSHDKSRKQ